MSGVSLVSSLGEHAPRTSGSSQLSLLTALGFFGVKGVNENADDPALLAAPSLPDCLNFGGDENVSPEGGCAAIFCGCSYSWFMGY